MTQVPVLWLGWVGFEHKIKNKRKRQGLFLIFFSRTGGGGEGGVAARGGVREQEGAVLVYVFVFWCVCKWAGEGFGRVDVLI